MPVADLSSPYTEQPRSGNLPPFHHIAERKVDPPVLADTRRNNHRITLPSFQDVPADSLAPNLL
jgi:hypothetical protein